MKQQTLKEYYRSLGISEEVFDYCSKIEDGLESRFRDIDKIAELNQIKVIKAMQDAKLEESHMYGTTGYGYNDSGREAVEAVYAKVFGTEDALVRQQITCGTHALTIALSANLRPGDEILSPVGDVYDTLQGVIGVREQKGSLAEFGITYRQVNLLPNGDFDFQGIKAAINDRTRIVEIQRSKGYDVRPSLSVKRIAELIEYVKSVKSDVICMVDNCYGEFVETIEPSQYGADMVVGSLIKNP
ncbi:MAG: methionine gamma-lyase family protein, partial [Lachnospiraceae bacterium]|nr:methionine gamma-lyase family protein [Lachnospiraceae bacterium]